MKTKINLLLITIIFFLIGCGGGNSKNFEQVGYYKEKLPNGSNTRVLSFYVKNFSDDPAIWDAIERFAKKQKYTSGGSTTVFFFNDRNNTPNVTFVAEHFDKNYEKYCVAAYWKYPTGMEKFSRYPFK